MTSDFKAGFVALIGTPNAGKSTLMNAILGTKISIVTSKPQTTRESILGILNEDKVQMIFLDTPGWLEPRESLQIKMKRAISKTLFDDSDLILWLVDPFQRKEIQQELAKAIIKPNKKYIVAINKMDVFIDQEKRSHLIKELTEMVGEPITPYWISARSKQGMTALKKALIKELPTSPPFYPTDQLTNRWERFYVAELIREKIFEMYKDEIPHASAVVIEEFRENPNGKDHIKASIYVESESQKKIMVGAKGGGIKGLGQSAREEIEKQIQRPIFLELRVKVKKNWRQDRDFVEDLHRQYD